jgi:hypothetical protein
VAGYLQGKGSMQQANIQTKSNSEIKCGNFYSVTANGPEIK